MKVAQEILTVIADSSLRELNLLVAGLRITFTEDEARLLAKELSKGMSRLNGGHADDLPSTSSSHPSAQDVAANVGDDGKDKAVSGLRSILSKVG